MPPTHCFIKMIYFRYFYNHVERENTRAYTVLHMQADANVRTDDSRCPYFWIRACHEAELNFLAFTFSLLLGEFSRNNCASVVHSGSEWKWERMSRVHSTCSFQV